jgi:hypothetical protein
MRQSPKSHLLRSSEHGHLPQDNSEAARNDVPSSEPKKRAPCSLIFTQMKKFTAAFKQPCDRSAAEIFQLLPWAMVPEEIQYGMRHRELGLPIFVSEICGVMPSSETAMWFEPRSVSAVSR